MRFRIILCSFYTANIRIKYKKCYRCFGNETLRNDISK